MAGWSLVSATVCTGDTASPDVTPTAAASVGLPVSPEAVPGEAYATSTGSDDSPALLPGCPFAATMAGIPTAAAITATTPAMRRRDFGFLHHFDGGRICIGDLPCKT
jgi:hypothetical protein